MSGCLKEGKAGAFLSFFFRVSPCVAACLVPVGNNEARVPCPHGLDLTSIDGWWYGTAAGVYERVVWGPYEIVTQQHNSMGR